MELFPTVTPDWKLIDKPRILQAQFGEGYSQESPDGLNAHLQKWELVFSDVLAVTAKQIRDFLVARQGVEKFQYLNPMGETITVKCREWEMKPSKRSLFTITATFEQVP